MKTLFRYLLIIAVVFFFLGVLPVMSLSMLICSGHLPYINYFRMLFGMDSQQK